MGEHDRGLLPRGLDTRSTPWRQQGAGGYPATTSAHIDVGADATGHDPDGHQRDCRRPAQARIGGDGAFGTGRGSNGARGTRAGPSATRSRDVAVLEPCRRGAHLHPRGLRHRRHRMVVMGTVASASGRLGIYADARRAVGCAALPERGWPQLDGRRVATTPCHPPSASAGLVLGRARGSGRGAQRAHVRAVSGRQHRLDGPSRRAASRRATASTGSQARCRAHGGRPRPGTRRGFRDGCISARVMTQDRPRNDRAPRSRARW